MNDDLISRQAVTDLIIENDPWWCEGMTRTIFDGIARLPSVDAVPQWIPVSERLPKESGIYLVTLKTDGVAYLESEFPNGFVYVSTYDAVIMNWGYGGKDVIAWMPLPEPYMDKHE